MCDKELFDVFNKLLNASSLLYQSCRKALDGNDDTAMQDEYLVRTNVIDLEYVLSEAMEVARSYRSGKESVTYPAESKFKFFYCGSCRTIAIVLREVSTVPEEYWADETKPEFWFHVYCPGENEYYNKRMRLDDLFFVKKTLL